jgi:ferredoxin
VSLRVVVDADQCQGNGMCAMIAPEVFALDDDSVAHTLAADVTAEDEPAVREAVDLCPRSALSLVET